MRAWIGWGSLALALQAIFWRLARLSASFEYDSTLAERPIPEVVGWLGLASVLWAAGALLALRGRSPPLLLVVLASIVFRLTLVPSRPIQEDDFYRYLWDGKVAAAGLDPYRFSPREIELFDLEPERVRDGEARAALEDLRKLRDSSRANGEIFARINHPHLPTIYPVGAQFVFAAVGVSTPHRWPTDWQVTVLKGVVASFDVGTLLALVLLLRAAGLSPSLALLYGWCPLAVKEFAGSGHIDSVACFAVVIALLGAARSSLALTVAGVVVAILTKIYAVVILPFLLLLYWRARQRERGRRAASRRSLYAAVAIVALVAAAQLIYRRSLDTRLEVLSVFLSSWENHDALFLWLRGALESIPGVDAALGGRAARGVAAGLAVLLLAYHAIAELRGDRRSIPTGEAPHHEETEETRRMIWRVFGVLAALFLLSPVGFPWYFTWCLPLLPFARQRAWLLLPGLLQVYYLRFWVDYRFSEGAGGSWQLDLFDTWIVSVEFGLFFAVWLVEWAIGRRNRP